MKTNRRKALQMALQAAGAGVSAVSLDPFARSMAAAEAPPRPGPNALLQKVEAKGWPRLLAHWKMDGDCQDAVGVHHGENHGIKFVEGRGGRSQGAAQFNGVDGFMKVEDHEEFNLGTREFSIAMWANLPENLESAHGDLLTKYDSDRRKGINLSVTSSSPSYGSQGDAKNLHFGIDNAINGSWIDCGRPWKTNPLVSTLVAYKGELYVGLADAARPEDACHVFRYAGGTDWVDCGRLGTHPLAVTVFTMIVHKGELYAGTGVWDWDRAHAGVGAPNHVYRYAGGTRWEDCGQFGNGYRTMALASFKGDLYAGDDGVKVFRYAGGRKWEFAGQLAPASEILFQSATVLGGQLYGSTHPAMYRYEGGTKWVCIGNKPQGVTQVHKLQVFEGRLYAGTWPQGKILRYEGDSRWTVCGQLGIATDQYQINEVNDLNVYNGKLYAGVLPKAEVYRYDRDSNWALAEDYHYERDSGWTRLRSMVQRHNWSASDVHTWFRVPGMTQFQGKLFMGTSTCFGRYDPEVPPEAGRVHSMEAGKNVSYDDDLGSGWKHVVAVREKGRLKL
ncbi:MAG: hypothetical protein ACE145_21735, partial [Terriglobia bacterium]